jgi:hypothetical protein
MLGLSVKLYLRILNLTATLDPKVMFIILIITLNLHALGLSEFNCNTRSNSFECGSRYKVLS